MLIPNTKRQNANSKQKQSCGSIASIFWGHSVSYLLHQAGVDQASRCGVHHTPRFKFVTYVVVSRSAFFLTRLGLVANPHPLATMPDTSDQQSDTSNILTTLKQRVATLEQENQGL